MQHRTRPYPSRRSSRPPRFLRPLGHLRIRGGDTRGSADAREAAARTQSRGARRQLARRPHRARVAAAAVARGRDEDGRSDHGAQSRPPQRLTPEAPSRWDGGAKQLAKRGPRRVRSRPSSGSTRALGARAGSDRRRKRGRASRASRGLKGAKHVVQTRMELGPHLRSSSTPAPRVSGRERSEGRMER